MSSCFFTTLNRFSIIKVFLVASFNLTEIIINLLIVSPLLHFSSILKSCSRCLGMRQALKILAPALNLWHPSPESLQLAITVRKIQVTNKLSTELEHFALVRFHLVAHFALSNFTAVYTTAPAHTMVINERMSHSRC